LTDWAFPSRLQYIPSKPEPEPLPGALDTSNPKKKKATTAAVEYEVLNPGSVASSSAAASPVPEEDQIEEDEGETVPEMTPVIAEFSKLPLGGFQKSWDFIKTHRDVVVRGASDALLVAGYRAERDGESKYAKQCVHQSLLLQYGEKLGRDGISVFFNKCAFSSVLLPKRWLIFSEG
jgi:cell division cycle protein 37